MRSVLWVLPFFAACKSYTTATEPLGPPPAEQAQVVFCQPSRFWANGRFPIWDGDKLIGFTENGTAVEYRCAPGEHFFIAGGQTYKGLHATLNGGNVYYVWVTPRAGMLTAAVGLTPVRKEDADLLAEVRASLQDTNYRALNPETAAAYEDNWRESVRAALAEFRSGARTLEPALRADDGHRPDSPPVPRP